MQINLVCHDCKNWINGTECSAFKRIPDEILIGENDHIEPLTDQQNDVVFEPIEKEGAE